MRSDLPTTEPETLVLPLRAHSSGSGGNVILVHGGFGSHTHWIRNIGALSQDHRVHALDLPGYGEAPDVPKSIDADAYLSLVHQGVRAVIGVEPTAVVGFSFGGAVAAAVCRRLGPQCTRLALLGPGGFGEVKGRQLDLQSAPEGGASDPGYRAVIRHNLLAMMLSKPEAIDDATIDLQCKNIARTRFNSMKVSMRPTLLSDLAAVTCPLHMIWGDKDLAAYPNVRARVEACRRVRPDMALTMIADAGHWVQYEAPETVNAVLLEFLRA